MGQLKVLNNPPPQANQLVSVLKGLIGGPNEAVTIVNGHACIGLLDTGSQITSVAESFYKKHLRDCTIKPLEDLVRVIGAGGQDWSSFLLKMSVSIPPLTCPC